MECRDGEVWQRLRPVTKENWEEEAKNVSLRRPGKSLRLVAVDEDGDTVTAVTIKKGTKEIAKTEAEKKSKNNYRVYTPMEVELLERLEKLEKEKKNKETTNYHHGQWGNRYVADHLLLPGSMYWGCAEVGGESSEDARDASLPPGGRWKGRRPQDCRTLCQKQMGLRHSEKAWIRA